MKMMKIATLSLAVLLYATSALAQHGGIGPASAGHGNTKLASSGTAGAAHGKTMDAILSKDTHLSGKIQSLTGMPAKQACSGFKNLGQCVAAAHVSKNLGISFGCLKSDVTGQAPQGTYCPAGTGTKSMSLGTAIQTLDPKANQKAESKKGESQATKDLKGSNS
jgi:hypothetical protein